MAARIHRSDPDLVLQALLFEIVTEGMNEVPIPGLVFEQFWLAPESQLDLMGRNDPENRQ